MNRAVDATMRRFVALFVWLVLVGCGGASVRPTTPNDDHWESVTSAASPRPRDA